MTQPYRRVLVAGRTFNRIVHLLSLGQGLAKAQSVTLQVVGLIAVPATKSLSTGALQARALRRRLEALTRNLSAQCKVVVAHDIWAELRELVKAEAETLTLLDWRSEIPADHLRSLLSDVVILKRRIPKRLKRILLPIRGGPYAELALRLALALAEQHDAEITLLHATPSRQRTETSYQEFLSHLRELPVITRWVNVQGRDVVEAIAQEAAQHQLVVMGAVAQANPDHAPVGPIAGRVMEALSIPVLIVKARRSFPFGTSSALSSPLDYTISVVVDKWFAENSFHASEFAELTQLVKLKERQGLTISLGLPALNEEATVGNILRMIQRTLVKQAPLVDELVLIDSMSTDRTVEIAQALGVMVYRHPDILPQYGSYRGKGEALWKSLAVLKGDLIAWVDTDIENFHPRFVYGILGPLIREPRLMYVKGYYQRPLKVGSKLVEASGGRVTELVARPLLNLFFPELSGMVQPLSGEYAGRRSALLQVPFFTGYGVETGLLIDMLAKFGLNAIGQVDLEERVHHSQSLNALSRMAFAITQVVMQRVGDQKHIALVEAMNQSLKQIRYGTKQFELEVQDIRDIERPPMVSLITNPHPL
jgi:glucosyl-3-phosphoglycerate synthase